MSAPIEYKETGEIVIRLAFQLVDQTYELRIPNTGEVRRWSRDLNRRIDAVQEQLQLLTDAIADAEEGTPEYALAEKAHRDFSRSPLYDTTNEWLQEVFKALTVDFPLDPDEWPAWLGTNSSLPATFIKFWQETPKASGSG